jgi:hypothetical protein
MQFANLTIVSYNAVSSLVRFENNIFSFALKNALAYHNGGIEVVNSKIVGLVPGANPKTSIYSDSVVKIYNATNSLARF